MSDDATPLPEPRDLRRATAAELDVLVRQLYAALGPHVMALGYRYFGGRRDLAEDLVAETFARVLVAIRRFEGRASFTTWVFRIALNVAAGWRRAAERRPTVQLPPDAAVADSPGPAAAAGVDEKRALVQQAMVALSPQHRMVLSLVVVDGLSQIDVATLLGVAPGTVWSRYARARVALARELERRGLGPDDAG